MKLSSKTLIANAALLILLTSFTAFIFLSSRYEEELREDSTQRIQEMNTFMKTLQGYSDTIAHNLLAYTINRDPSSIITIQEAEANLQNLLTEIIFSARSERVKVLFLTYVKSRKTQTKLTRELIAALKGQEPEAMLPAFNRWLMHEENSKAVLHDLIASLANEVDRESETIDKNEAHTTRAVILFSILVFLGVVASAIFLNRSVIRPIARLTRIAATISKGDLSIKVERFNRRDEIGSLAAAFGQMTENLIGANADLEKKIAQRTVELQERNQELQLSREAALKLMRKISALREINLAMSSTLDLRTVLNVLMEKIDLFLPYAAILVWLVNQETGQLERAASWNLDEKDWMSRPLPDVPELVKTAMENKQPVISQNVQTDPRTLDPRFYKRNGLISYLRMPLLAKDAVLGVLVFLTREEHAYDYDEMEFLSSLASQAAIAIHNSQLHQKTQRQALRLEEASRLRADFTAMIAHDLRSPLSNIVGIAEMMGNGLFGALEEEQKNWLDRMRNNATGLVDLVSDFLDLSKLETGHIELSRTACDIRDLVRNTVENYRPVANSKNVVLTSQGDASLPPLYADGRRLDQVLNNLLSNAVKFTPEGGAIQIRVRPENGAGVMVQVEDSGVGIAKNEIANLFQKYRQASSATLSAQKGTGLGLVICKMIVEAHGGRIWAESEEGKGTTLTFTLPFDRRSEQTDDANLQAANS